MTGSIYDIWTVDADGALVDEATAPDWRSARLAGETMINDAREAGLDVSRAELAIAGRDAGTVRLTDRGFETRYHDATKGAN